MDSQLPSVGSVDATLGALTSVAPQVVVPDALLSVQRAIDRVAATLASWTLQPLVSLRWRDRNNPEHAGNVEIAIAEVRKANEQAMGFTIKFQCRPRVGQPVTLTVRIDSFRKGVEEHHFRAVTGDANRDWAPVYRKGEDWVVSADLPKPRGIPVLEQLADVWFNDGNNEQSEIAPRVEPIDDGSGKSGTSRSGKSDTSRKGGVT